MGALCMNKLKLLFVTLLVTLSCNTSEIGSLPLADNTNFESYDVGLFSPEVREVSRNSAVKVKIRDKLGGAARGSGTLFKFKKHHIIITAAHLFTMNPGEIFVSEAVIISPQEKVIGTLVYYDREVDIAIFTVPDLESRVAAPLVFPSRYRVGDKTVYSGFPGANNLLTLEGVLAGRGFGRDLAMQSFAWGGSSGSGVFGKKGTFLGVLVSIMVGPNWPNSELVPDVVYLAPSVMIDKKLLLANLRQIKGVKHDGF